MTFTIRSMSTTNASHNAAPTPYHLFLLPSGKRASAWWTPSPVYAAKFATLEEAEAEWRRSFGNKEIYGRQDIAPLDCATPIWEGLNHIPAKA